MNNSLIVRFAIVVVPVVTLVALLVGCRPVTTPPAATVVAAKTQALVSVGVVREQLLKKTIELPTTIESDETALLLARVEAYVGKVFVDIGEEVKKGQILVELHAPEIVQVAEEYRAMIKQLQASEQVLQAEKKAAQSQLEVARAQLKLKQSVRDRRARLVSTGAVSEQLLEESEAAVQTQNAMLAKYANAVQVVQAKIKQGKTELIVGSAKLKQAMTMVDYLKMKAPFDGVIAERNVDPGNLVRPGTQNGNRKPLLVVSNIDVMRAIMHATTDVAGQLVADQEVTIVADDSQWILQERIARVAGVYNSKTRMMRAEVDIDNLPEEVTGTRPLRAGTYGSATITLQAATLPVVPESALRRRGDRTSVVIVRDGACLVTPVKVAFTSDDLVGIEEGIAADDQVVADPDSVTDEQLLKDSEIKMISW